MTLGVVKPEPPPVVHPTFPQPNQQVSGGQFNQFLNFGGNVRTRTLTSGCTELDAIFEAAGRQYNLSPDLLKAVAKVESNFRTEATSPAGAVGIMQLMPGTASHLGVDDPFNPAQSIFGGARYLRENLDRFDGDIELALAAYNAGWPAVKRHGGIPPFRETQAYVPRVLGHLADSDVHPSLLAISFDSSRGSGNFNFNNNNNFNNINNNNFNQNHNTANNINHNHNTNNSNNTSHNHNITNPNNNNSNSTNNANYSTGTDNNDERYANNSADTSSDYDNNQQALLYYIEAREQMLRTKLINAAEEAASDEV